MKRMILVVDDEEGVRDSFSMALEDRGYEVVTAPSANEALKIVAKRKPDLIFSDLKMAGMDGDAFIRAVLSEQPDIPVYVVTAFYEEYMESLQQLLDDGLKFNVMRKPVGLEQIRMVVESVFGGVQLLASGQGAD